MTIAVAMPQPATPSAGRCSAPNGVGTATPKTSTALTGTLSASAAELQRHHRLRPRHGDVEAAIGGEDAAPAAARRRGRAGSRAPCAATAGSAARQREERLGQEQQRAAGHGERERRATSPAAPRGRSRAACRRRTAGRRSGRSRGPRPSSRRRSRCRPTRRRRARRGRAPTCAPTMHRVDGAEGEHRDLADEHRPGQGRDAARALAQAEPRHAAARTAASAAAVPASATRPPGRARRSG